MSTATEPIRILLADDDSTSLFILEAIAQSLNLQIAMAMDVASAKKLLPTFRPQIAILDVLFPDGDGVDVLLDIRRMKLEASVAIISATLEQFPFHKVGTMRPDMIFKKPLDADVTRSWLEKQIARIAALQPG